VVEPGKGALDHPTTGQQDETAALLGTQDNRQAEAKMCGHPVQQASGVAAIDPDGAQLLTGPRQAAQEMVCAVAILDTRCGDQHHQHQSQGIDQNVALASIDVLAGIVAAPTGCGGSLDTLAIQATGARVFVTPEFLAQTCPQGLVDAHPSAAERKSRYRSPRCFRLFKRNSGLSKQSHRL
jgi:hypothetical protein